MDAQELRNLQEAYLEVYSELDENRMASYTAGMSDGARASAGTQVGSRVVDSMRRSSARFFFGNRRKKGQAGYSPDPGSTATRNTTGRGQPVQYRRGRLEMPKGNSSFRDFSSAHKEEVDLYDIILSHLLDEGYAETPKAAEAIMVNMSEEWIGSIVEEVLDEAVLGARKGHIRSVIAKGGGPGSIKYVASGGDIVANDRAAQERSAAAERKRAGKNKVRTAQFQQANKKSIERLNSKPGEDSGDYNDGDYGDDDTSNGKRYYKLSHTNRAARRRRETGR